MVSWKWNQCSGTYWYTNTLPDSGNSCYIDLLTFNFQVVIILPFILAVFLCFNDNKPLIKSFTFVSFRAYNWTTTVCRRDSCVTLPYSPSGRWAPLIRWHRLKIRHLISLPTENHNYHHFPRNDGLLLAETNLHRLASSGGL